MNSLKYFNKLSEISNDIKYIRTKFFNLNIKTIYVKEYGIIILYTKNSNFNSLLSYNSQFNLIKAECNGLIIDTINKKILMYPIFYCNCNIKFDKYYTKKYIQDNIYTIFKIKDGTKLNLYYFKKLGGWVLSTNKGYNVLNIIWRGISFEKALEEVLLNKLNISLKNFYNSLNKTKCYTIGIKHPQYHPFGNSSEYDIWFIQSINLCSNPLNPNFNCDIPKLTGQEIEKNIKIENLIFHNYNALSNYLNNGAKNFGYIIMSNKLSITGKNSNIMLTSNLMNKIKKFIYFNQINNKIKQYQYNDYNYIVTYNYLKRDSVDFFINLFPKFNDIISKLEYISEILVTKIEEKFDSKTVSGNIDILKKSKFSIDNESSLIIYNKTAEYLYNKINTQLQINFYQLSNLIKKLIYDFIRITDNTDLYYQLLEGNCPFDNN